MSPLLLLATAVLGGVGSAGRFAVDTTVGGQLGTRFPWGTTLVNLSGSFVLGLLTGLAAHVLDPSIATAIGTGLIGGYTTFSTASIETVRLWLARRAAAALANALTGLIGCVLLAAVGFLVVT